MKERANPPSRRGLLLLVLLLAAVSLALSGCVVVWSIQVVRLCERTAEELPVMLDARGPAGFSSAERGSPFSCHVLGLSGERRLDRDLVVHKAEKPSPSPSDSSRFWAGENWSFAPAATVPWPRGKRGTSRWSCRPAFMRSTGWAPTSGAAPRSWPPRTGRFAGSRKEEILAIF